MAAITGAVIGLGTAAYGVRQAGKAAGAQVDASNQAISEQRRQFDLTREDMAPWMQAGGWALGQQQNFLKGDRSGFETSPDYAYARDEMISGLDRSAASRGRLYSGGQSVDLMRHVNGLAQQNSNSYWNKLAGVSNTGQVTAGQLGQFGQQSASNIGNLLQNAGDARASGYINKANAWGNFGQQLGGWMGQMYGNRG